jgi:hypothetical protein
MCKLICILTTASNADGFCGSSDPVVLLCSGVWGAALICASASRGRDGERAADPLQRAWIPPRLIGLQVSTVTVANLQQSQ